MSIEYQLVDHCPRGFVVFIAGNDRYLPGWCIFAGNAFERAVVRRFAFEDEAERAWADFAAGVPTEIIQGRDYAMSAGPTVGEPVPLATPRTLLRR